MLEIRELVDNLVANVPDIPEFELSSEYLTVKYLQEIYNSLHQNNFSFLGCFVGRHRSGKSLSAVLFSSLLDSTFLKDIHMRVVYSSEQFIKAVNYLRKRRIRGGFIVWDEAGVGLPAREWYDMQNKSISYAIQVAGYLNPAFIFVSPDISYIDTQPRKMFQAFYNVNRPSNSYTLVYPYDIVIQRRTGKIYWYRAQVDIELKDIGCRIQTVLCPIKIYNPPKEIQEKYEEVSVPWKEKILEKAEARISDFEDGKVPKKQMSMDEIIETILKNPAYYETDRSQPGNRKLSTDLIKYDFDIPLRLANVIRLRVQQILNQKDREGVENENSG